MAGRKKQETPNTRFFCMKCSMECPTNFFGKPNCEECQHFNDCNVCGRKNTEICEKCDHHGSN